METVCGLCKCKMIETTVSPCVLCGKDLRSLESDSDEFYSFKALNNEVVCSSCVYDFHGARDPMFFGFPSSDFNCWSFIFDAEWHELNPKPKPFLGTACINQHCQNSLRLEKLVKSLANEFNVVLPKYYWKYLENDA